MEVKLRTVDLKQNYYYKILFHYNVDPKYRMVTMKSQNSSPTVKFGILQSDLHHLCKSNAFKIVVQLKTQHFNF